METEMKNENQKQAPKQVHKQLPKQIPKQIIETKITEWIAPLGYDLVALEASTAGQRKLQLFIDRKFDSNKDNKEQAAGTVGIEDCIAVTKAIDEPLDQLPETEKLFAGHSYELEVSSPGIDRPLRTEQDFTSFAGKMARIHVFRPLNAEEIGNAEYQAKNPKQKNFVGTLVGLQEDKKLLIALNPGTGKTGSEQPKVTIPLALVAKANLEPTFDFNQEKKA